MTHKKKVLLYHFAQCPYCKKVRDFIASEGINLPMIDILITSSAKETLVQIGGKSQVPCLVIDGTPLFESNDIIQWIKDNRSFI